MEEYQTSTEELLKQIRSNDKSEIREAFKAIESWKFSPERIRVLLSYKNEILSVLDMQMCVRAKHTAKIFEYYEKKEGCICSLFYERENPEELEEKGYVEIQRRRKEFYSNYLLRCRSCGRLFYVEEFKYYHNWYSWKEVSAVLLKIIEEKDMVYGCLNPVKIGK